MTLLLLLWTAQAQHRSPDRVLPVFKEFCWECHGDGSKKGGFVIDGTKSLEAMLADRKRWGKAVLLLQSHVMPPIHERQPSPAQRHALLEWIDSAIFQ